MKLRYRVLVFCMFSLVCINAEGFVEEVSCSSESLTVVLNKSDPDIIKWMQNPTSQPLAYVYGFKSRTPCGVSLRASNGLPVYNFTIQYGRACSVFLSNLEPDYQTAETTIAIEDNSQKDESKPMRVNHVFCLYTRRVQAQRLSEISKGHEILASTGGRPKPKVHMIFKSVDGRPVRAVKFGDRVGFYLALSPDNAYKGILPKKCQFSDQDSMETPGARKVTFVQSNCPVKEMTEIIRPLNNVNEEVYYTNFNTFRFGNQSTLYAHCTVQVCLDPTECSKTCFRRETNSNLTADRLRLRLKRDAGASNDQEISISNALTVLDGEETVEIAGQTIEMCIPAKQFHIFYILIAILTVLVFCSTLFIGCLTRKLRLQTKDIETRTLCSSAPLSAFGNSLPRGSMVDLTYGCSSPAFSQRSAMRSVSEISGPRTAWGLNEHYIPRVK